MLEHLGARDYEAVPRADGGPGQRAEADRPARDPVHRRHAQPALVTAVDDIVRGYDMRRTILLQGSDAPGATTPAHCSFGGEGTPYNHHLLPTIGVIAAPQSLYDPAFGLEGIDFDVMHRELLGYTELVSRLGTMTQAEVEGACPPSARSASSACRRARPTCDGLDGASVAGRALSALPRVHSVPPMLIRRVVPTLFALALLVPSTAFAIPNTNGGGTGPDPDAWPTARLSAPDHALQYSNVTLDASGSSDDDGRIVKYEWDFDGAAGWDRTTTSPRTTAVLRRLPQLRRQGARHRRRRPHEHRERRHPRPSRTARELFVAPGQPTAGKPATLVAKASYASAGNPRFDWDLDGNGSYETPSTHGGYEPELRTTFAASGQHTVGLRVTDRDGYAATTAVTFKVKRARVVEGAQAPNSGVLSAR